MAACVSIDTTHSLRLEEPGPGVQWLKPGFGPFWGPDPGSKIGTKGVDNVNGVDSVHVRAKEFGNLWNRFCGCVGAVLAQVWRYAGALLGASIAPESPSIAPCLRQHSADTATKVAPQVTEFLSTHAAIFRKRSNMDPFPGPGSISSFFFKMVLYVQR